MEKNMFDFGKNAKEKARLREIEKRLMAKKQKTDMVNILNKNSQK